MSVGVDVADPKARQTLVSFAHWRKLKNKHYSKLFGVMIYPLPNEIIIVESGL